MRISHQSKAYRIVNGKPTWTIVDDTGNIVNRNPTKGELKHFREETYKRIQYTDQELLNYLTRFERENGRPPTANDFRYNPKYPCPEAYLRFGSWQKSLKLVGLDFESMTKRGIVTTNDQKARLAEIIIRDHFRNNPIDLSGDDRNSPLDGICPNGNTYDVKSSKLIRKERRMFWQWSTNNKYKEEIEIYYLLGFNEDWTKLEYVWRVFGEMIDSSSFYIRKDLPIKGGSRYVGSMKEYDITDKIREILRGYDL